MIIRSRWLPPKPFYAFVLCKGIILWRKDCEIVESLLAHERVHEREWSVVWLIKWLFSPVFRMKAEVRGYAAQAKYEGKPLSDYEQLIIDNYLLNSEAKTLLPEYIKQIG